MTPASGTSSDSASNTMRPRREVVGLVTVTWTGTDRLRGSPSTVAAALTVRLETPGDCPTGAETVRIDVWPAVIRDGANDAVASG